MTENAQTPPHPPEDEIRLIDMLDFLVLNKNLILSIASFFTLSSVIYCFSATAIYKATISFIPSQEFHISEPTIRNRLSQIQQSIFKQFIDQMKSPDLQQKVATEGGFLEKFKDGHNDTTDTAQLISRINNSITTSRVNWNKDLNLIDPATVEITGKDPKVISEFLNALSDAGIKTAQNKTYELITQTIQDTSQKIQDTSQKIQDKQFNINILEQEIKILRKQAKAIRLRKIEILKNQLEVAKNFTEEIDRSSGIKMAQNITFKHIQGPFEDYAFLNGEKENQALINILEKRTNDDLFNPNIIKLLELIKAYKNNQIYQLPSGGIRYGLPLRILKIEPKTIQAEDLKRNLKKRLEVIITSRKNFLPEEPITPEKTKIIPCAIIIGLFIGICTAIIRSGLRILKKTKSLSSA